VFVEYFDNESKAEDVVLGHCRESQATMVFMFLAAALFVTSGLVLFLRKRKGY
jgi:LPXTG-motif cell wall-anchored protein